MNMDNMKATMMAYEYADRDTVMSEAYADWTNMCDVLQLFSGFIDSFDGSPTAFATAEPLMNKIFQPSFTLLTDDGPKNLEWYRAFCKAFAADGSTARVTNIKTTGKNGIQVNINNVVAGTKIDPITFNGVAEMNHDGQYKIVYFEPVTDEFLHDMNKNVENVGKMIKLVGECKDSM